jgi:hypothetical protein
MKVETAMDAGGAGHFLIDNQVMLLNIEQVRVTQEARYAGARPSEPVVEYLVKTPKAEDTQWVPAKRAAPTKAELLAKL